MNETGINLDKNEEIIETSREVAMAKHEHRRKWGSNRKQRNLKWRWEVHMQVVDGKFTDSTSSIRIKQTDEVMDVFAKELERNSECEEQLNQTDCWMRKRNKVFRKMMDWFLAEDRHGWHKKRESGARAWTHVQEMGSGF